MTLSTLVEPEGYALKYTAVDFAREMCEVLAPHPREREAPGLQCENLGGLAPLEEYEVEEERHET